MGVSADGSRCCKGTEGCVGEGVLEDSGRDGDEGMQWLGTTFRGGFPPSPSALASSSSFSTATAHATRFRKSNPATRGAATTNPIQGENSMPDRVW